MRFSNVNAHFLRRFALLGALVCEGRAGFRRAGVRSFEAHDEAVNSLQLIVANCETGRSVRREPADAQTDRLPTVNTVTVNMASSELGEFL